MRLYDLIDIELCKKAPRGWSESDYVTFSRGEFWLRRQGGRGPYATTIHNMIRTAHQAYKGSGMKSPWGDGYVRCPEYDGVTFGMTFPAPAPVEQPPPAAVEPEVLKSRCARCGFLQSESEATPAYDLLIESKMMLSMRKDARQLVELLLRHPGHTATSMALKGEMEAAHDVDRDRTSRVLSEMAKFGILSRPAAATYRLVGEVACP